MAVISVIVTDSEEQVVSGIPRVVTITTNISSSIFYTLDGSTPTLFSLVYTDPIYLPVDKLSVTLKIYATNGVDSSPVVTETYVTNMASGTNARLPRASTDAPAQESLSSLFPFGNGPIQPNATFQTPADAGVTVHNPELPATPTGYDGSGNPTGFTNQPYDTENYNIKYSTTNKEGETGHGIGTLPATVQVTPESPAPETTDQNSSTFDPRAYVIFQDASTENPNDPPHINRMHFSLENPEKTRDGNLFFNAGLDSPPVSGTFLRQHYNPRLNTMTYYYLDTWSNKWIISTMPYTPDNTANSMAGSVLAGGRGAGGKYVYEWIPFARRVLF